VIGQVLGKLTGIVAGPAAFFESVAADESDLVVAWKYLVVLLIPVVALSYLMNLLIPFAGFVTVNNMGSQPGPVGLLIGHVLSYVFFSVAIFVIAGIYFLMLNFMGLMLHFRLTYTQVFQVVVYGCTPMFLLGNFPYIEYLGSLWTVVVLVIGIKVLGKTSYGVAATALIVPVAAFMGCIYAVVRSVLGAL
jgi:hypothetical protein